MPVPEVLVDVASRTNPKQGAHARPTASGGGALSNRLSFAVVFSRPMIVRAARLRASIGSVFSTAGRLVETVVPQAAAGLALACGLLLLASGSLPSIGSRLDRLHEVIPLALVEASHLTGSIAGLLLVVLARGLHHRLFRAWLAAMILLVAGILASLAKGLDWEEAFVLLAALLILRAVRPAFYRVEGGPLFRIGRGSLVAAAALLGAALWVGSLAYAHVDYRAELWWRVDWSGDASRFLRASLAATVVLGAVAANSLIFGRGRRLGAQPIPDAVRRLVAASPETEAAMALIGDKSFLVAPGEDACLPFVDTGRTLIAKGDPVGDPEAGRSLIRDLRDRADRTGRRCAFYAVGTAHLPDYLDLGLTILKVGEVATVPLTGFTLDGPARKDLRQARARACRDGLTFETVPRRDLAPLFPELRAVSDAWLATRSGEEKGFALGAFDEAYLANFDMAVLRRAPAGEAGGEVVAFANLLQGAGRAQLSVDLMRHRPDGPRSAMDALFAEILAWGAAEGFAAFSLGAVPFAGMDGGRLAPLWSRVGHFIYAHGERLYGFEGLRAFKQKFEPVWTPSYLACPGGLAAPQVLYEVNVLISGGVRGLLR